MKKAIAVAFLAFSLMGLTACAGNSSVTDSNEQTEEFQEEGIEGVEKIKLRYEKIDSNARAYIYCLDTVAYFETPTGIVATPQYDSLCRIER
jgi:hypothetical protein